MARTPLIPERIAKGLIDVYHVVTRTGNAQTAVVPAFGQKSGSESKPDAWESRPCCGQTLAPWTGPSESGPWLAGGTALHAILTAKVRPNRREWRRQNHPLEAAGPPPRSRGRPHSAGWHRPAGTRCRRRWYGIGIILQDYLRYHMLVRESIGLGRLESLCDSGSLAALDANTEYGVFQRFADLTRGRIAVLISHPLSTVCMADPILVLNDRATQEQGTHPQLVSLGGRYAELFEPEAAGCR